MFGTLVAEFRRPFLLLQNPSEEVVANCNAEVNEVLRSVHFLVSARKTARLTSTPRFRFDRVLKPGPASSFIYLTFAQPHFRRRYLTREGWDLTVKDVGDGVGFGYYQFVLKRKAEAI